MAQLDVDRNRRRDYRMDEDQVQAFHYWPLFNQVFDGELEIWLKVLAAVCDRFDRNILFSKLPPEAWLPTEKCLGTQTKQAR